MKFIILCILIYFHYGLVANDNLRVSSSSGNVFKNYKLTAETEKAQECNYCPIQCSNGAKDNVLVQTAFNILTMVNEPFEKDIMAHVYYSCTQQPAISMADMSKYRYQKICGSASETCNNFHCGHESNWVSQSKGRKPILNVNLILPSDVKRIKVNITNCNAPQMIFGFHINNKSIDYVRESRNYSYMDNIFVARNLRKLPITLIIEKFRSDIVGYVVFNVVFNVANIPVRVCPTVNKEYCSHLCNENQMQSGSQCIMKVDNKDVEIETQNQYCKFETSALEGGMCELFQSMRDSTCEYICVSLRNCRFMCVKQNGTEYIETGYKGKVTKNNAYSFGSGNWTIDNIPNKEMIYVNECELNSKLCTNSSCKDEPIGFKCTKDDYNEKECQSIKNNSFVHCPNNKYEYEDSFKDIREEFELLKDFNNDSKMKIMDCDGGKKMLSNSFRAAVKILTMQNKFKEKNFARPNSSLANDNFQVFDTMESILRKLSRLLLNTRKYFEEKNSSYYAYGTYVNETGREYSIPLPNNETDNEEVKQFVRFEIKDIHNKFRNEKLIATFIRYTNIDSKNENLEAKQKADDPLLVESENTSKLSISMFKNSDIISLALSEKVNVRVNFKLKTNLKLQSSSWKFRFEDECGYLVPGNNLNWSTEGCTKQKTTDGVYFCECNHLSNFAMLVGIKPCNQHHIPILKYLSIIGGSINIISLTMFLIFVLLINSRDKLRLDQLNIAICLLFGCLLFLFGGVTSLNETLCKISAIVTHFLLLAAFVWKLILGINVVRMITSLRYQNEDWMIKYRMVTLGIGYAIPIIIVSISGTVFWDSYRKVGENTCWIYDQRKVLLIFLIPIGIILAINLIVLFFIANTLIRNYINTRKAKVNASNELLVFLQLVVSMGLTWVPLCFSVMYITAMYIWIIFFPLQGLMMFLFVVVINRENREKVSAYLIQRYSSLRSKSTSSTDMKSTLKSRSVHSKSTEHSQSLLSDNNKENDPSPMGKLIDHHVTQPTPESVC